LKELEEVYANLLEFFGGFIEVPDRKLVAVAEDSEDALSDRSPGCFGAAFKGGSEEDGAAGAVYYFLTLGVGCVIAC